MQAKPKLKGKKTQPRTGIDKLLHWMHSFFLKLYPFVIPAACETAGENQEILLGSYNDVNYIAIIRLPYFYAIYTKTYINLIVVFQTNSHIRNKI